MSHFRNKLWSCWSVVPNLFWHNTPKGIHLTSCAFVTAAGPSASSAMSFPSYHHQCLSHKCTKPFPLIVELSHVSTQSVYQLFNCPSLLSAQKWVHNINKKNAKTFLSFFFLPLFASVLRVKKSSTRSVNQVFKIQVMCERAAVCALLWIIVSYLSLVERMISDLFSKGGSHLGFACVYVCDIKVNRGILKCTGRRHERRVLLMSPPEQCHKPRLP